MSMVLNTQTNSDGVLKYATGNIITNAVAAAAQTFTLGFAPRRIVFTNLTDGITDTWFEGMPESNIYVTLIGITAKLDADAGVTDTDYTSLWNPTAIVAGAGGPTSTPPYDVAGKEVNNLDVLFTSLVGILAKLDADAGVTDTTYTSLWKPAVATAAALRASIVGMNLKLDNDAGVTGTDFTSSWTPSNTISLHAVAAGDKTYEKTNGIAVVGNTFALTATTMVASKQFYWEAQG